MTVQQAAPRNPDGTNLGYASTDLVALYGVTPAAQKTLAVATSLVATASSADVDTNLKAAVISMMTIGQALGLWA